MHSICLRSAALHAEVVPEIGGSLARLDWIGDGARLEVLRGMDAGAAATTANMACFPLVPWSNRMAPDGFLFEGRRIEPAPNRAGEPCPIHGDGWQQAWTVERQSASSVDLVLDRSCSAPFAYLARQRYQLDGAALRIDLEVENRGPAALPFGLGLHPWLRRTPDVTLLSAAATTWLRGDKGLPAAEMAIPREWDFKAGSVLPADTVDHIFTGWDGVARIRWPASGLHLQIRADMDYFILYAPKDRDFFCFEPVDHMINAHNLPGMPGLTVLAPGQKLLRAVTFSAGRQ